MCASVLALGQFEWPGRPVIVLGFLIICPGMAWTRLLRLADPLVEWTLAVALSLAIAAVVAAVMVYGGVWNPGLGLLFIAGITLVGALLQVLRGPRVRATERRAGLPGADLQDYSAMGRPESTTGGVGGSGHDG
jgi:hypothetical protein